MQTRQKRLPLKKALGFLGYPLSIFPDCSRNGLLSQWSEQSPQLGAAARHFRFD
jgi:hypothetical protein